MRKNIRFLFVLGIFSLVVTLGGFHKAKVTAAAPPAPPPAPPPSPIISLTAEPATGEKGQFVTLSWTSQNATELSIQPDGGKVQATGTTTVTPQDSTTYVASATGPGGTTTASARGTVTTPPPPPARPTVTEEEIFSSNVEDAYFDFDKSGIQPDAQQALTADADLLKAHPDIVFTIEGHCDERGSKGYNLGLGNRRASAAKNFLVNGVWKRTIISPFRTAGTAPSARKKSRSAGSRIAGRTSCSGGLPAIEDHRGSWSVDELPVLSLHARCNERWVDSRNCKAVGGDTKS